MRRMLPPRWHTDAEATVSLTVLADAVRGLTETITRLDHRTRELEDMIEARRYRPAADV